MKPITTREQRDHKARSVGEGTYFRKRDHAECAVDVTFYPRTQLWITEDGKRRATSAAELAEGFDRLKL